jgi:serine/threonine-protein kinase
MPDPANRSILKVSRYEQRVLVMPEANIEIGTLVNNRYHIRDILGQGGFGRTYLASDAERFDELCVLKEFVPNNTKQYAVQRARELFEREARTLYKISHPQIPKFLAWFEYSDNLFIVQEYIDGKTYFRLLNERLLDQGQPFSETEVNQWLHGLLPVLIYLHENNIVHRDISPENMMLPNGQSQPVLIDFGLVKQTVSQIWAIASNSPGIAAETSFVGKFGYSPPEQIRLGQCYPCSDLYSLAVSAVVLLTGREPSALMNRSLEWQWRSYVDVSDHLAEILDKMLAEKPSDRYQSAQEILNLLHPISPVFLTDQPFLALEIEIDEAHKNLQIAEIEETDYFKQLHAQAELLRNNLYTDGEIQADGDFPELAIAPEPVDFSRFDPAFIQRCQQLLNQYVGVMATCILEDAVADYPDATEQQLIEMLATEIPNPQHAEAFRRTLTAEIRPRSASTMPVETSSNALLDSVLSDVSEVSLSHLDPDFLDRCQRSLSRYVGMMATCILEDALADHPDVSEPEFIAILSEEIPNPQQSEEFKRTLTAELSPQIVSGAKSTDKRPGESVPPDVFSEDTFSNFDAAFIDRCQHVLSRYVGMMATCILEDTLADHPDVSEEEFIEMLAEEIPNPQQSAEFKKTLKAELAAQAIAEPSQHSTHFSKDIRGRTSEMKPAKSRIHSKPESSLPTPDVANLCTQELSRCIGPMAKYIVEDTLEQEPQLSVQQLIEALSAEIPNPKQAAEFRQRLQLRLSS